MTKAEGQIVIYVIPAFYFGLKIAYGDESSKLRAFKQLSFAIAAFTQVLKDITSKFILRIKFLNLILHLKGV